MVSKLIRYMGQAVDGKVDKKLKIFQTKISNSQKQLQNGSVYTSGSCYEGLSSFLVQYLLLERQLQQWALVSLVWLHDR